MSQDMRNQRKAPPRSSSQSFGQASGQASSQSSEQGARPLTDAQPLADPQTSQPSTKTRPVHEIRFGRIVAAIWENYSDQGAIRYNVTVCRIYKSDNQWRETQSFGRDDLPLVAKVIDLCHTWIFTQAHPGAGVA